MQEVTIALPVPFPTNKGGTGSIANANAAGGVVVPAGAVNAANGAVVPTGAPNTANGAVVPTGAPNTANGAVILDAAGKLPVLDGSALTGINILSNVIYLWTGQTDYQGSKLRHALLIASLPGKYGDWFDE